MMKVLCKHVFFQDVKIALLVEDMIEGKNINMKIEDVVGFLTNGLFRVFLKCGFLNLFQLRNMRLHTGGSFW